MDINKSELDRYITGNWGESGVAPDAEDDTAKTLLRAFLDVTEDYDIQEVGGEPLQKVRERTEEFLQENENNDPHS